MTSIAAYKLYGCPKCNQIHVESLYGTINFKYPPPPNKKESDLIVCQRCAAQMLLEEFNYLGVKERPRNNYGTWESIVRKVKGIKPESSPVDLYPYLSYKPLDLVAEAESFSRFGMKPERYPTWFKDLVAIKNEG